MGIFIFKDGSLNINGKDVSDHVREAHLRISSQTEDATTMGCTSPKVLPKWPAGWQLTGVVAQDFSGSVDDLFSVLQLNATAFPWTFKASSAAKGATNPLFSGEGYVTEYEPIGGAVGALAVSAFTIMPASGGLSRDAA